MAGSVNTPTDLEPPQDPVWSILNELAEIARKDESELRKILRPHEEAGLSWVLDAPTILRRDRLDSALVKLTLLEISYQVHKSTPIKGSDPSRPDPSFVPIPARSSLEI